MNKRFNKFFKMIMEQLNTLDKWDELRSQNGMLDSAANLCKSIETEIHGSTALIVGGAVRDLLMGNINVHDVDIATNAPLDKIEQLYKTHDIGKSKDFGIVTVRFQEHNFEVANFRIEEGYSDNRRPDKVSAVDNFETDSKRRDFTFNAMGLKHDGTVVDYNNGVEDIKNQVVRAVGNAKSRFSEDALRLLRAVRFAAKFGFNIEEQTERAIKELAFTVNNLSPERVRDELFKAAELGGPVLARYILKLDHVGLLEKILPEIKDLQNFDHNPIHHPEGGVFDHIIACINKSPSKDPVDNLAVMFHDIGKAVTLGHKEDGSPTYYGHEQAGLPLFDKIANRLKISNKDREAIELAISEHMHGHNLHKLSDKKIISLRQNPNWPTLKNTIYSDEASRLHLFDPAAFEEKMDKVEQLFQKFGDTAAFEKKMSDLVNGQMIMELIPGIKGPQIGKIKNQVRDIIIQRQFDISLDEVVALIKQLH